MKNVIKSTRTSFSVNSLSIVLNAAFIFLDRISCLKVIEIPSYYVTLCFA